MSWLPQNLRRSLAFLAVVASAVTSSAPAQSACNADLDRDGTIGCADLAQVLSAWGPCAGCEPDLTGDSVVDSHDLSTLLGGWGATCASDTWYTVIECAPNPSVVTNAALRNAIVATGLPWRVRDKVSQIVMLLVPPGTFSMGCSASAQWACYPDELPVHTVTLTNPYYIGRFEVTQSQWTAIMGSNPSAFQGPAYPGAGNQPVERVSWNMVQGFLKATGLRLPTEAEWEFACRAGTTTAFHGWAANPNGTNIDSQVVSIAWFASNSANRPRPVGGKPANGLGLYDMHGNVFEWTSDWWSETYYASSPSMNPTGPATGVWRVFRGGSWLNLTNGLRSSARYAWEPFELDSIIGFRVARNP